MLKRVSVSDDAENDGNYLRRVYEGVKFPKDCNAHYFPVNLSSFIKRIINDLTAEYGSLCSFVGDPGLWSFNSVS